MFCFDHFVDGIKTHLFVVTLIFCSHGVIAMYVSSIISRININIGSMYFQNIYLSWIISQTNCYDDQLSRIQGMAAIVILFCALVDIVSAYFTLLNNDNESNTSSNNKNSKYNNSNNNKNDNIIINTVASNDSTSTNLKENDNHDVVKRSVANTLKATDVSNSDKTGISFATHTSGQAFISGNIGGIDFIGLDAAPSHAPTTKTISNCYNANNANYANNW